MRDAFLCCTGAKGFEYGEGCFDILIDPEAQTICTGGYYQVGYGDFSNDSFIPYQFRGENSIRDFLKTKCEQFYNVECLGYQIPGGIEYYPRTLELDKDIKYGEEMITDENTILHILLPDGDGEIYLDRNSKMTCSAPASPISCSMLKGKLRAVIKKLQKPVAEGQPGGSFIRGKFDIRTPSVLLGVRGTEFMVEVADDGTTKVQVFEGAVNISDLEEKNTVQVNAGQKITVVLNKPLPQLETFDTASIDRWWKRIQGEEAKKEAPIYWCTALALSRQLLQYGLGSVLYRGRELNNKKVEVIHFRQHD